MRVRARVRVRVRAGGRAARPLRGNATGPAPADAKALAVEHRGDAGEGVRLPCAACRLRSKQASLPVARPMRCRRRRRHPDAAASSMLRRVSAARVGV